MVLIMQETELSVLISLSAVAGYFIGIATQEEIEKTAKKLFISSIFSYPFMLAEIVLLAVSLKSFTDYYFLTGGVFLITNLILSTFYSAEKSDLQRILLNSVILLISNLILGTFIII